MPSTAHAGCVPFPPPACDRPPSALMRCHGVCATQLLAFPTARPMSSPSCISGPPPALAACPAWHAEGQRSWPISFPTAGLRTRNHGQLQLVGLPLEPSCATPMPFAQQAEKSACPACSLAVSSTATLSVFHQCCIFFSRTRGLRPLAIWTGKAFACRLLTGASGSYLLVE